MYSWCLQGPDLIWHIEEEEAGVDGVEMGLALAETGVGAEVVLAVATEAEEEVVPQRVSQVFLPAQA